jgi:hypothetical protein
VSTTGEAAAVGLGGVAAGLGGAAAGLGGVTVGMGGVAAEERGEVVATIGDGWAVWGVVGAW